MSDKLGAQIHAPLNRFSVSAVALVICLLAGTQAQAFRFDFVASRNGVRIQGAEVCFIPGNSGNQIASYFSSAEFRCLPADDVIDVPEGDWHFFVRHRDGLTSDWPGFISLRKDGPGFKTIDVLLTPAGRAKFTSIRSGLKAGHHLLAYFPGLDAQHLPFFLPLGENETELLVPADRQWFPIVVEAGRPIWIGTPQSVHIEEIIEVENKQLAPRTLVASVRFDRDALKRAGGAAGIAMPKVSLKIADGIVIQTAFPLHHYGEPDLIIIPGVPEGTIAGDLVAAGAHWQTARQRVSLPENAKGVYLHPDPLIVTLCGNVTVKWKWDETIAAGKRNGCDGSGTEQSTKLMLLACGSNPGLSPDVAPPRDCRTIKQTNLASGTPDGQLTFEDVEPGTYWVRFEPGFGLTPWHEAVTVAGGDKPAVTIEPHYASISGRVTQASAPVHATVTFAGGFGTSDPVTASYRALLVRDPKRAAIRVKLCGSNEVFLDFPERNLQAGDVYDIDLASKPVNVKTVDAVSGSPIARSDCWLVAEDEKEKPARISGMGTTEKGTTEFRLSQKTVDRVARAKPAVCCSHREYKQACLDWPLDKQDEIVVRLEQKTFRRGKVELAGVVAGRLFWVSPSRGVVTEQANIDPAGSFVYENEHAPDDYLVFVSRSHPLYVLPLPQAASDGSIALAVPPAAVREARIQPRKGAAESTAIAIAIGDRVVPQTAFSFHQAMRGRQADLQPGEALTVGDLAATGTIRFYAGYPPSQLPGGVARGSDYFLIPAIRTTLRSSVLGAGADIGFD